MSACGSTLADVPALHAHQIEFAAIPALAGRAVAVQVIDQRPAKLRKNQAQLEQALNALVTQLLASRGMSTSAQAPLRFTLTVRDTADIAQAQVYPQERCVQLVLRLEQGKDWSIDGLAFSCHHLRNGFGMTVGGDIDQAYRLAFNQLFGSLVQQVQQMGPPPAASAGGESLPTAGETALLSVHVWPPSAQVYIDGAAQPEGNVEALKLPAGAHRVRVQAKGLMPYERTVELHPRHHEVMTTRLSAPTQFGPQP